MGYLLKSKICEIEFENNKIHYDVFHNDHYVGSMKIILVLTSFNLLTVNVKFRFVTYNINVFLLIK